MTTQPLLDTVARMAMPRLVGTAAEKQIRDEIASEFSRFGLDVAREPFEASWSAVSRLRRTLHSTAALLLVGSAVMAQFSPWGGLSLIAVLWMFVARAASWSPRLERAFDRSDSFQSENVIATAGPEAAETTIVVMAHYDSKSAKLPTFFPVLFLLVGFLSSALVTGALIRSLFLGDSIGLEWVFVALGGALFFFLGLFNPIGNDSPGAMDNASGVATLLEAARRVQSQGTRNRVCFLATGAEELGLCGALRWIQRHTDRLEVSKTLVVNVDSVGVGRGLLAVDVHGRAPNGVPVHDLLQDASLATGIAIRRLRFLPGVGVDTMPFASRGYATVSLLGQVLGKASRRIHRSDDQVAHLSEEALQDAVSVVLALIERMERTI